MSDIVERLLHRAKTMNGAFPKGWSGDDNPAVLGYFDRYCAKECTEAADELTSLRAALADERRRALDEAAKALDAWGDIYGDNAAKTVRALKEKPE